MYKTTVPNLTKVSIEQKWLKNNIAKRFGNFLLKSDFFSNTTLLKLGSPYQVLNYITIMLNALGSF